MPDIKAIKLNGITPGEVAKEFFDVFLKLSDEEKIYALGILNGMKVLNDYKKAG